MSEWVRRVSAAVAVGALGVSLAACGEPDDNAPHPGEPTPKLMLLRLATTDTISTGTFMVTGSLFRVDSSSHPSMSGSRMSRSTAAGTS